MHLHSAENAKRARAALDTYDKLKIDAVVTTGRGNMAALSKAQLETRQRVSEVGVKADLVNVIGDPAASPAPAPAGEAPPPLGWKKLVKETQDALKGHPFLRCTTAVDGTERCDYSSEGEKNSRAVLYRADVEQKAAHRRRVYQSFVDEYRGGRTPGTQNTGCPTVLAIKDRPKPDGEPDPKWRFYTRFIAEACAKLAVPEADLKRADDSLKEHPTYQEIVAEIDVLEPELAQSEAEAKRLLQKYEAAKKALALAEEEAAKRTVAQQTEAAKAELAAARAKVGEAVAAIEDVVDASLKAGQLVQVQIQTDVVETILSNAKALTRDPEAAAAKPTQQLLAIVKKYPEVAGRLRAAEVPPVNVLLLELGIQRLQYRRLQAVRDAKRDVVEIRKLQRDALADSTAAWIKTMDAVIRVRPGQDALSRNFMEGFTAATPAEREHVAEALVNYAAAKLSTEERMNLLNARLRERYRAQSLEMSEIAVATWNDLIRAPLSEITAYHEGGITSEEIARLVNALGIMAIAVGVYQ